MRFSVEVGEQLKCVRWNHCCTCTLYQPDCKAILNFQSEVIVCILTQRILSPWKISILSMRGAVWSYVAVTLRNKVIVVLLFNMVWIYAMICKTEVKQLSRGLNCR